MIDLSLFSKSPRYLVPATMEPKSKEISRLSASAGGMSPVAIFMAMPSTIADFIGDTVNDIAGNCSDLLESFVATVVASILIANTIAKGVTSALLDATTYYPVVMAAAGLLGSVLGILFVQVSKKDHTNPSKQLNMATYIAAALAIGLSGCAAYYFFGNLIISFF